MSDIIITIEGGEELLQKAAKLPGAIAAGLQAGGVHVKGKIAEYPPRANLSRKSVYGTSFVSDRQRRWFFAIGIHQTPYNRTTQLGQSWSVQTPQPLQVIVGSSSGYGRYVQDPGMQSLYHKAQGWKNTDDVAKSETEPVKLMIQAAIDKL